MQYIGNLTCLHAVQELEQSVVKNFELLVRCSALPLFLRESTINKCTKHELRDDLRNFEHWCA